MFCQLRLGWQFWPFFSENNCGGNWRVGHALWARSFLEPTTGANPTSVALSTSALLLCIFVKNEKSCFFCVPNYRFLQGRRCN
jgi:hypothetical protein